MCVIMIASLMPVYSFAQDDAEIIFKTEPDKNETQEFAEGEIMFLYTQTVNCQEDFCSGDKVSNELSECGINFLKEIPSETIYDTKIKSNPDGTLTKSSLFVGYTCDDTEECLKKVKTLSSTANESLNYCFHEDSFSMPIEITNPTNNYNTYTKWWMENSVHIPQAWQQYDTMGDDVVVAVIDSGVYVNNPEIAENIWEDANGNRGYDVESGTYNASPKSSHGGNVAGIVAAVAGGSNSLSKSLVGVAPHSKIIPINVNSSPFLISASSVVSGINYAIANGADIITMSLSTTADMLNIRNACRAAYDAGITVIASAGNNSQNTTSQKCYPAAYSFVIGVMAYGTNNQLCDFSNYDSSLNYYDVAAPGYRILGLAMTEAVTSLTCMSGTSQATPIVAGLAALYFSIYPDHTPEEFRNALINSSTETVRSNASVTSSDYYFPKVNALNLLGYYDTAAPAVEAFAGTPTVIDNSNSFIYGLEENYASIDDYVSVSNGDCEFIPAENGNGTGSTLRVYYLSGEIYRDYEIVVFGDTDGDAVCDGMDCAMCQYVLDGGAVPDCVRFAADVDFDDAISQTDLDIITGCGLKSDFVSQIR